MKCNKEDTNELKAPTRGELFHPSTEICGRKIITRTPNSRNKKTMIMRDVHACF